MSIQDDPDEVVRMARGVLYETLHGPVPMATVAALAQRVLDTAPATPEGGREVAWLAGYRYMLEQIDALDARRQDAGVTLARIHSELKWGLAEPGKHPHHRGGGAAAPATPEGVREEAVTTEQAMRCARLALEDAEIIAEEAGRSYHAGKMRRALKGLDDAIDAESFSATAPATREGRRQERQWLDVLAARLPELSREELEGSLHERLYQLGLDDGRVEGAALAAHPSANPPAAAAPVEPTGEVERLRDVVRVVREMRTSVSIVRERTPHLANQMEAAAAVERWANSLDAVADAFTKAGQ